MKSSIKVHFKDYGAGMGLKPTINVLVEDSEDPRDSLLKSFFEQLGGISSWLEVSFDHHIVNGNTNPSDSKTWITIIPVNPGQLKDMREVAGARLEEMDSATISLNKNPLCPWYPLVADGVPVKERIKKKQVEQK